MKVERSISISRPPADVLAYTADVRNDPSWHTDVLEVRAPDGPVAVGTVFEVKVKPSMGVSEGTMTVTEYEPDKRIVFDGRMGKMNPKVTNAVAPEGSGTLFVRIVELEPSGFMRVMTPMIKSVIGKSNTGFLKNLKQVLEGS